jgi:hypothetical protein
MIKTLTVTYEVEQGAHVANDEGYKSGPGLGGVGSWEIPTRSRVVIDGQPQAWLYHAARNEEQATLEELTKAVELAQWVKSEECKKWNKACA